MSLNPREGEFLRFNLILRDSHIIKLMYSTNEQNLTVPQLLNKIKSNLAFKQYHQGHAGKGLFIIIKNTFDEMVQQLQKFRISWEKESFLETYDKLKSGRKVWAYYEFKVFAWIVAWLQFQKRKLRYETAENNINQLLAIFPNKSEVFLKYQYYVVASKIEKAKSEWLNAQIMAFSDLMKEFVGEQQSSNDALNWKFISFRLYAQKGCLKTPNQCRERWKNHLSPYVCKRKWDLSEDLKLMTMYEEVGPKWSYIARKLTTRTEHMVKNRFHSLRHKWMLARKPNAIFNIATLIRQLKTNMEASEQQVQSYQLKVEEGKKQNQREEEEENNYEEKPPSEEKKEDDQQSSQQKYQENKQVHHEPTALSFADVAGDIDMSKSECRNNIFDELIEQRRQFEELLDDPLWKNSDRIPTSDYDWLDDIMEKQDIQRLNEFI